MSERRSISSATGDKYFGVCTMMATLPGLPMFGHGQIEGFTEKYGMEYKRPRYDEGPNEGWWSAISARLRRCSRGGGCLRRAATLCSTTSGPATGAVDENVFAYSNRSENGRAIVLFHNHYGTRGVRSIALRPL